MSQMALVIAEEEARDGAQITVVGLSTTVRDIKRYNCGNGSVEIVAIQRPPLNRQTWAKRLAWTFATNMALVRGAWPYMRTSEKVRFTGSPPFLLYWMVPWADPEKRCSPNYGFYPECIVAAIKQKSWVLNLFQRLRIFFAAGFQNLKYLATT